MNAVTKIMLEKAVVFPNKLEKRDAALDIMYDKLIVIPIQKAWRSKSPEQKAATSKSIRKLIRKCTCCYMSHAQKYWDSDGSDSEGSVGIYGGAVTGASASAVTGSGVSSGD